MALQYYLTENHLTPDPNDYNAKTINVRSYTLKEIIERIANRGMTLTKVDISAVLQAYHDEVCTIIEDGGAINTPLFNTQPSISGVFTSPNDSFDSTRHKIHTKSSNGTALRDGTTKIQLQKVTPPASSTIITALIDKVTNTTNDQLTATAPVEITGKKIKITDEVAAGVFFVAADGTVHRAMMVVTNNPSNLVVMTPALTSGTYTLEIRTHYSGSGNPLKNLRTVRLNKTLTVA